MSLLLPPEPDDPDGPPRYRQRPRPVGFEIAYTLQDDVLTVDSTRRVDKVPLATIEQVRFLFQPGNITSTGYKTQLRLKDGRTITIGDTSWRSMVDIERGGAHYVRFIEAIVAGVSRLNPEARFVAGKPALIWAIMAAFGLATLVGVLAFAWIAHGHGATGALWIALGLGAVAAWQMTALVLLNRPRALASGEIPAELMPKPDERARKS
jgi:hypothetical protein